MGDQVIKIIVKSETKGDEKVYIRHFIGSNTYFEDFKKKIITRFPYLREKEYKLYWIDEDLDQITIFYEEDFRIFIENFESAKNRIYVEERVKDYVKFIPITELNLNQTPASTSGPNVEVLPKHKHVICDGCQNEIVGMRYKCLECKDFDICKQCEQKMIHRDHTMLRFYIPAEFIDWSNVRFDKFVRKYKHHGKHHEFPSKIEITVENEEPPKDNQEKCEGRRHFKRGGRHHGGHHKGGQPSNIWINMMKYMNDLANQDYTGPQPSKSAPSNDEPTARPCFRNEQQATADTTKQKSETKPVEKETYDDFNLGNLINMIAKTSLGIDEVVNSGVHKVFEHIIQATTPPAETTPVVSVASSVSEGNTNVEPKTTEATPEMKKDTVPELVKEPVVASSPSEVVASSKPPRSMESTPDPDEKEWDVIDEEIILEKLEARRGSPALGAIPKEAAITLKNMSTNTSANDIPTLISFEENNVPQNTNVVSSSQSSIKLADEGMPDYAKLGRDLQRHIQEQMSVLQDNEKEIYHRKPHVNSAVITMMAMGFSNEGGWLTQLLDSVDGNISKALDLLQPNK